MTAIDHGPDVGEQLLLDPHPLADRDRATLLGAILAAADMHDGRVSSNDVRSLLLDMWGEYLVKPQKIGGVYTFLRGRGILADDGHERSTDRKGGNAGRMIPRYRLVDRAALVDLVGGAS